MHQERRHYIQHHVALSHNDEIQFPPRPATILTPFTQHYQFSKKKKPHRNRDVLETKNIVFSPYVSSETVSPMSVFTIPPPPLSMRAVERRGGGWGECLRCSRVSEDSTVVIPATSVCQLHICYSHHAANVRYNRANGRYSCANAVGRAFVGCRTRVGVYQEVAAQCTLINWTGRQKGRDTR